LIDQVASLLGLGQTGLLAAFVVFLRVGSAMALVPAFGEQSVPQRIRLILALVFTIVVFPAAYPFVKGIANAGAYTGLFIVTEVLAGLVLGMGLRLFILALQMAGAMAAQATSLSQVFGGAAVEPQPAMGHILVTAGLAIAVTLGLHVRVAEMFILSYSVFSPGEFISPGMLAEWGVAEVGQAFALGFTLAAPFVIASLIYNIALGVINRAMPQLMVAFVGAPAITAGGLILMLVATPIILSVWSSALMDFVAEPFGGTR